MLGESFCLLASVFIHASFCTSIMTTSADCKESLFFVDTRGSGATAAIQIDDGDHHVQKVTESTTSLNTSAWVDEDECDEKIQLTASTRGKKLRHSLKEGSIGSEEYERRLRAHLEEKNPKPKWAQTDSLKLSAADQILSDPFSIISREKCPILPDRLSLRRLRSVNARCPVSRKYRGGVIALDFHPTQNWALVAGSDRTLRIFQIDVNNHLDNAELFSLRVAQWNIFDAKFTADGRRVIMVGASRGVLIWDMKAGRVQQIAKLAAQSEQQWGAIQISHRFVAIYSGNNTHGAASACVSKCIVLLDAVSLQVLHVFQTAGVVHAVQFCTRNPNIMYSVGSDNKIQIWSLDTLLCIGVVSETSGTACTALAISTDGSLLAVGSNMGILSIYDTAKLLSAKGEGALIRSIMNLTTRITSIAFHPAGEVLIFASADRDNALRVLHLHSMRVYSNWPRETTPLGRVHHIRFHGNSLMSIGNAKGSALLYSYLHYESKKASNTL